MGIYYSAYVVCGVKQEDLPEQLSSEDIERLGYSVVQSGFDSDFEESIIGVVIKSADQYDPAQWNLGQPFDEDTQKLIDNFFNVFKVEPQLWLVCNGG